MAPLCDSRGNIRYFIGAQIDVSGLAMEGAQMESLQEIQAQKETPETESEVLRESKSEFQEFNELLSPRELQNVREHGGNLFQPVINEDPNHRLFLQDSDTESEVHTPLQGPQNPIPGPGPNLSLTGVYKNVCSPYSQYPKKYSTNEHTVPSRPSLPIPPHPFHFSLPPNSRHAPILIPEPHRRDRRQTRPHS
jgi:hypothetical protein